VRGSTPLSMWLVCVWECRPLTGLSDPMSGFFGITRQALNRGVTDISPLGLLYPSSCHCLAHPLGLPLLGSARGARSLCVSSLCLRPLLHRVFLARCLSLSSVFALSPKTSSLYLRRHVRFSSQCLSLSKCVSKSERV